MGFSTYWSGGRGYKREGVAGIEFDSSFRQSIRRLTAKNTTTMKTAALAPLFFLPSALATTVYLAGDSTMAKNGGGSGTNGMCRTFLS